MRATLFVGVEELGNVLHASRSHVALFYRARPTWAVASRHITPADAHSLRLRPRPLYTAPEAHRLGLGKG